jgi:hypothetical protein
VNFRRGVVPCTTKEYVHLAADIMIGRSPVANESSDISSFCLRKRTEWTCVLTYRHVVLNNSYGPGVRWLLQVVFNYTVANGVPNMWAIKGQLGGNQMRGGHVRAKLTLFASSSAGCSPPPCFAPFFSVAVCLDGHNDHPD